MSVTCYRNESTRKRIGDMLARTRKAYSLEKDGVFFEVTPPKESSLKKALLASNGFLEKINLFNVNQVKGQAVTIGSDRLSTGRAKTRFAGNDVEIGGYEYELSVTDSVIFITWERLAQWANAGGQKEFEKKLWEYCATQFANDMLRVGWNGLFSAKVTNLKKYANGEDINEGWHARIKRVAPEQVVGASEHDAGVEVYFDPDGARDASGLPLFDYKTLDAMGSDLLNNVMDEAFRESPDLVFIVGRDLVAAAQYRLFTEADKPTEHLAAQLLEKSIAGRPAYVVPYFPGKRMVLTSLKNLSIYTQTGTQRRKLKDNDDLGRMESYWWRFQGYMVEEPLKYAAFDESVVVIGRKGGEGKTPSITTGLQDVSVARGTPANLTVVCAHADTFTWYVDSAIVGVSDDGTLSLDTAQLNVGEYNVKVVCTGEFGSAISQAVLTVTA